LARAGLPTTIRFHDLRHSCATLLLAQGVPLVVVRDTLGHTQISTTADIYGHVLPDTHRQAVDGLDTLLGGDMESDQNRDEEKENDANAEADENVDNNTTAP
jgi:integrase-like protein